VCNGVLDSESLGLLFGEDLNSEALSDAGSVFVVDPVEMRQDALLDVLAAPAQATRGVAHDTLALRVVEDLVEQGGGLLVVGVRVLVVVAAYHALVGCAVLHEGLVLDGTAQRVGFIVDCTAVVAVGHGVAIANHVVGARSVRAVDRHEVVVGAETVPVRVRVGEKTALQHLIQRRLNARDQVGRRKGGLLGLREVILRVAVQHHLAHVNQRVV